MSERAQTMDPEIEKAVWVAFETGQCTLNVLRALARTVQAIAVKGERERAAEIARSAYTNHTKSTNERALCVRIAQKILRNPEPPDEKENA